MAEAAEYKIVFIMADATIISRVREGAKAAQSTMFGYPPKRAIFATRYYPTRKAWRVYDLRQVTYVQQQGYQKRVLPRHLVEIADEDAAVMWAVLRLNG